MSFFNYPENEYHFHVPKLSYYSSSWLTIMHTSTSISALWLLLIVQWDAAANYGHKILEIWILNTWTASVLYPGTHKTHVHTSHLYNNTIAYISNAYNTYVWPGPGIQDTHVTYIHYLHIAAEISCTYSQILSTNALNKYYKICVPKYIFILYTHYGCYMEAYRQIAK